MARPARDAAASRTARRPIIVCPVSASAGARGALGQAAALARARYAELHLLHVPRGQGSPRRGTAGEEEVHPTAAAAIGSLLDAVRPRGEHIRLRIKAQRGKPESAISAYARRHRAGLIVISASYRGGSGAAGLSLARYLGRSAPCPVLVVPETRNRGRAVAASFRTVACALDFTKISIKALEAATAFVPRTGGVLNLVHSVEDASSRMIFSGSEAAQRVRARKTQALATTRRLLEIVPAAVLKRHRVRVSIGSGPPSRLVVEVASDMEADLIVMGMPRRSRFDEWIGGSTSRAVLRNATSPVLLVPA